MAKVEFPSLRPWRAKMKINPKELRSGDRFIRSDGRTGFAYAGFVVSPIETLRDQEVLRTHSPECLWREQGNAYRTIDPVYTTLREQDTWYLAERDPSFPFPEEFESVRKPLAYADLVETTLWFLATGEPDVDNRSDALKALEEYRGVNSRLTECEGNHTDAIEVLQNLVASFEVTESGANHPALDEAREFLNHAGIFA